MEQHAKMKKIIETHCNYSHAESYTIPQKIRSSSYSSSSSSSSSFGGGSSSGGGASGRW